MADTYRYLLGPHGVFEGTPEEVQARGYDPWQAQLFSEASNPEQFGQQRFTWSGYGLPGGQDLGLDYAVGYVPGLLDLRAKVQGGQATETEQQRYATLVQQAQAIPLRDAAGLTYDAGTSGTGSTLSGASPDLGGLMLRLADRIDQGQASAQERALFQTTERALREQNYRASVPQASDANPFGLGDQLFGALMTLGLGATGGLAGGALAAGTAGLGSTLGSLGTLAGVAGTGAGMVGQATDQDWLSKLGLGLGVAGGLAGGIGGLSNLWSRGVNSLSDAARLAQSAGKITGALGRIPGADPLKDVSRYLGYAGQAGQFGAGIGADDWLGWSGTNSPLAANVAPAVPQSNVSNLLSAADMATQRGGGDVADFSYEDFIGWGDPNAGDPWNSPMPADTPGWEAFTGWGGDETQQGWYQNADLDTSGEGAGGLWGTLGSLGSGALKLLLGGAGGGTGAGALGPLLASLGAGGAGAIGSNAASEASRLQAAALNRGIDLSEAQWLQQQARTQPWVQAGQQSLSTLQGLAGQQLPGLPGATPAWNNSGVPLPSVMPGWTPGVYQGPQTPNAADYRWTPGQGPQAAAYRYAPGLLPDAAQYASGAPQLYQGGMPGTQVPTLTGQQVLDQDPGAAFRQSEARRALEGSAAARGDLLSGQNLKALQSRSQDLASQEYQNAWQRMMARSTEQYGRDWGQYQQAWNQGVQGTQLGLQTNAQNFQQAQAAAALREQVNQVASQQGWSQAQTEAVFREQMAQQASQQGFTQALAGQQNQFSQGLQADQWNQRQRQQFETDLYSRLIDQNKLQYGRDAYGNETDYARQQALYKQQLAQYLLPWEQNSTLASLGAQVTGQLGNQGIVSSSGIANLLSQLGSAQGTGAAGQGLAWTRALGGAANQLPSLLASLNA